MAEDLVRATLAGQKTETRRPMKFGQSMNDIGKTMISTWFLVGRIYCLVLGKDGKWPPEIVQHCPYGVPGDRLWVRETWGITSFPASDDTMLAYRAERDHPKWHRAAPPAMRPTIAGEGKGRFWIPSIHMPRWAARVFLEVTGVRAERLHDIDEEGANREGVVRDDMGVFLGGMTRGSDGKRMPHRCANARQAFVTIWDSIYGIPDATTKEPSELSWAANPWVWVVGFKLHEQNDATVNNSGKQ